ncbi:MULTISPECIES: LCP family protein [unclassified Pseudonocardia]|uniref:LCP family protein n=1 Tax=unclassified Pseudonocardia TaxID=2619320 RepID=UPI0001FFE107|nr:LCP family protein [Pseudonocardia sp. Ae707_Ps1]OLM20216.1 Cell envelope-associated transcriptional attenuator LytR-CpsA-Psr, subfamily A1 [Pseudonocardia sp. Ae707_Ps1]
MRNVVTPPPVKPRRTGRRLLVTFGALVLVLLLVVGGGLVYLVSSVGNDVPRIPGAFQGLDAGDRPATFGGTTFLLVGTDSRSDAPTTGSGAEEGVDAGSERSDVIMLGTFAPDGQSASVVSIPRDSWVDIPGRGMNKINAAYAFGGPSLLIGTVEQLTGVRVDHFGVVDFAGFTSLVDSVGGIDVTVARATSNAGVDFVQGENHLDGAQALAYVRQRYDLPNGDIDRAARQQNAMKALLEQVQRKATTDPAALYTFATSVGDAVSIDDSLSNTGLVQLAVEYRNLRGSDVSFLTAPVAGLGREGAQSVVYLDDQRGPQLWDAIRNGSVEQYADANPSETLSGTPS